MLGMQSVLLPSQWLDTLRAAPRLREQLRRARAKGVTVRMVSPDELGAGAPLREVVEGLQRQWLASRSIEPMGFLVSVEPFHHPEEHLYLVAEHAGRAVQFLSAVPVPASHAWLLEDMLRAPDAPNGTTELLFDHVMRTAEHEGVWITPGLTPLAGPVRWWLRAVSFGAKPLYDFTGLRRFRARLHPSEWRPVWLIWDRGPVALVLLDVLRAFARRRLLSFAWRSFTRHPNGPPWIVAVPLVPWTLALMALLLTGQSAVLGFSNATLAAWIAFDLVMVWALFRAARRPRAGSLLALSLAAGGDAAWSLRHLAHVGVGDDGWLWAFRVLSATGPVVGTIALLWAAHTARRVRNSRRRNQRFSAT
jgi:hypothetical protein